MANNNETVNDIRAEVGEYLSSIGPSEFPSETQVEEFADRFVTAHNREMNALAAQKTAEAHEAFVKNAELAEAIAAKDAMIAEQSAVNESQAAQLRDALNKCEELKCAIDDTTILLLHTYLRSASVNLVSILSYLNYKIKQQKGGVR